MRLLLHACCAPCSIECVQALRDEDLTTTLFWYNPNIHPFTEYKARKQALEAYATRMALPLALHGDYGLRSFIGHTYPDFDGRCTYCYQTRLMEAARYAAEHGFDAFSTTLLISPYQRHDEIRRIGGEAAALHGIDFLYRDFRPRFRVGQQKAREMALYMQKYCGCIFSEEERYAKNGKTVP